jgi:hypothetical protein
MRSLSRFVLMILTIFLSATAVFGGIGLITGANAPPASFLQDSIFPTYVLPGLALMVLVGGSGALSAILLLRSDPRAWLGCLAAALIIIVFECVEIAVVGSPEGLGRNLQIFYLGVGVSIGGLAPFMRPGRGRGESAP